MKRALSLLLAAVLLLGLPGGAFADEPTYADKIEAQAFAVAMTCYDDGYYNDIALDDAYFLWEAAGWWAAWLWQTEGLDLVSETQVRDFQRALGSTADAAAPEWLESTGVRILRAADDVFYDFAPKKLRMGDLLGQTLEYLLDAPQPPEAVVTLRQHFAVNSVSDRQYILRFAANPDEESDFAYMLQSASAPIPGPQMDPKLDFDWDALLAANSLKNVFSLYDSVKVRNNVKDVMPTWIFRRNGSLCILRTGTDYAEGEYRGCWFRYEPGEDGKLRPRISGFDEASGDDDARDAFLSKYVFGASVVNLEGVDGDLIRTRMDFTGDWSEDVAIDRGLLLLRESRSQSAENGETIVTSFTYGETPPEAKYLDSWDGPMRSIRLVWEDWYDGEPHVRHETVSVPLDWEYLPWEARWGDYTIYMNEGYTRPYAYPGDGVEYTLYLTTAKG